jgi:hypothetical protein
MKQADKGMGLVVSVVAPCRPSLINSFVLVSCRSPLVSGYEKVSNGAFVEVWVCVF